MKTNRLLLFSAWLIVLALAQVNLPSTAQTPLDSHLWPSFTEPSFGFTVSYPPGWVVRLVADNPASASQPSVARRSVGFFGPNSEMFFVDVWLNPQKLSLSRWTEAHPLPTQLSPTLSHRRTATTLGGRPALETISRPADTVSGVPWHFLSQTQADDLVFALEYAALEPDVARYAAIRDSFRLTEATHSRHTESTLSSALPPASFGVQEASCCGISDFEYNPFPCNTGGGDGCFSPPCGNCTWWVRYRRLGDSTANLTRCTGDANTWERCAQSYYPSLFSLEPNKEAVVIHLGENHVSFIENLNSTSSYRVSQLSWYDSCPDRSYTDYTSSRRSYIWHPDFASAPNQPPNLPELLSPEAETWQATRTITLKWASGGDPDEDGEPLEYFIRIDAVDSDWYARRGWISGTAWELELPADGAYTWRVKASDGQYESGWTRDSTFYVDATPPNAPALTGPNPGYWYKSEQSLIWQSSDAPGGSGVDHIRWAWNDDSPGNQQAGANGGVSLSQAGPGQHVLYAQAVDKLGHVSAVSSWGWVGYDVTPPTVSATGPQVNQWYNQPPLIQWTATDAVPGSGVAFFGWAWPGLSLTYLGGAQGQVTPPPVQGQYHVEVQAWDTALNASPRTTLGWFGYDSLAPARPTLSLNCSAPNNQPQNHCNQPTFTWQSTDLGWATAGVAAYAYAWHSTPDIAAATWSAWGPTTSFTPPSPLPAQGRAFLHVKARDSAGNESPVNTFGLWYDPAVTSVDNPQAGFGLSLNDGAFFSPVATVTVKAQAPVGFSGTLYLSDSPTRPTNPAWHSDAFSEAGQAWLLPRPADFVSPQRVYGWFRDDAGLIYGPYHAEIILDSRPPQGSIRRGAALNGETPLTLTAWDLESGLSEMRLGVESTLAASAWQAYAPNLTWPGQPAVIYAQYQDRAGNLSPIFGTDGSNSSLTERLYLPIVAR